MVDQVRRVDPVHTVVDEKDETVRLVFENELQEGTEAALEVRYSGAVSNKLAGYYQSEYVANQETKYMAVTQFEPTDARRAFPCWDEPNIKASFAISMRVQKRFTALSNMDVQCVVEDGDWKIVKFNQTPIMSTYLVAFVVGELDFIEGLAQARKPFPVRIYTPQGYSHQAAFALDVAVRTLEFFTEYLDIEYPLPKMDMIAVPDFGSGAMENWGLVTYRMVLLLVDQENSTISARQHVTYVIAHELAHQWFGNLVTMDWWSELWLNEGFATWMGYHASDHLFPEWDVWTEFYLDDSKAGLELDSLASSHPVEVETPNPAEISQVFDSISYSKGAALIRMLASYLGPDDFRRGLIDYLQLHQYGNARTCDLWDAFARASGKQVRGLMGRWTQEMGYPMVSVTEYAGTDGIVLTVEQNRFLLAGASQKEQLWTVPMNIVIYDHGRIDGCALEAESNTLTLDSRGVYNLNGNQTGFYRVLYPVGHFGKICATVADKKGSISDYLGVLSDAFAFGVSGHQSSVVALDLLECFRGKTTCFFIWSEIASHLRAIQSVLYEDSDHVQARLGRVIVDIFRSVRASHGWMVQDNEDAHTTLLRTLVLSMLGANGDVQTVEESRERFGRFVHGDRKAIHANFKGLVFSTVVKHGGVQEYEQVFRIYQDTVVPDQKLVALSALASTQDPALIQRTLDYTLMDSPVRPQDVVYLFRGLSNNLRERRMVWDYVKSNWAAYFDRFNRGSISLLRSIVSAATRSLVRGDDAQEVEVFFGDLDVGSISRTLEQSLEKIRIHSAWLDRDRKRISDWLLDYRLDNK